MKKLALIILLAGCVATTGYSQIKSKLTLGMSLTDLSKTPADSEVKAQPGILLGSSFVFGDKFYFEPGIYYTVKATDYIDKSGQTDVNRDATISGLRIPVSAGLYLLGSGTDMFAIRAFGGGSVFFVTGTGDDLEKDDIESPTWGVHAGAGIDFWKLFLDVSYEWSLTNVQKDISSIDVGKMRSLYIAAGFKLYFNK